VGGAQNPPDLSTEQRSSLAEVATTNKMLYRAYLLKEQLRELFRVKGRQGRQLLAGWLSWAPHSGIPELVTLAASIRRYRDLIHNTPDHALSNARSEATDTRLRALTKRAYGFHSPDALIAMALLTRGGLCPPLPGRTARNRTHANVSRFSRHRSHPLIQAYTVSRNQDDTASQADHRATFSPERTPHKQPGSEPPAQTLPIPLATSETPTTAKTATRTCRR
jgi:Transposase